MNIISSLPVIRYSARGVTANPAGHEPIRQQDQSAVAQEETIAVPETNKQTSGYRSERVDLRGLQVDAENLAHKRALNTYQTTARIIEPDDAQVLTGLDLFA